jgi:putative flippase GtrA
VTDWAARGARFLAFGVFNTLVTYAIYCVLVIWLHAQLAYALVFVLGIAIAYVGNAAWVFRARMRWAMLLPYAGIYLATYFMNAGLIHVLMAQAGVGPRVALAIALVIVTPLSFLLNHAVLGRDARPHA